MRKQYNEQDELDALIEDFIGLGMRAVKYEDIFEGQFVTFATPEDEVLIFNTPPSDNEMIIELQHKLQQQDAVIEELMFVIIPSILGGEL